MRFLDIIIGVFKFFGKYAVTESLLENYYLDKQRKIVVGKKEMVQSS